MTVIMVHVHQTSLEHRTEGITWISKSISSQSHELHFLDIQFRKVHSIISRFLEAQKAPSLALSNKLKACTLWTHPGKRRIITTMEGANRFQKEYVYFSKPLKIAVSYKFEMKFASESKTKLKTNQTKKHRNKNLPLQEIRNVWLYFPVAIPYFQLNLLYFSANFWSFPVPSSSMGSFTPLCAH